MVLEMILLASDFVGGKIWLTIVFAGLNEAMIEQWTTRATYLYTNLPADWNTEFHWLMASCEVFLVASQLKRSLDLTALPVRRALQLWFLAAVL